MQTNEIRNVYKSAVFKIGIDWTLENNNTKKKLHESIVHFNDLKL